MVRECVVRLLAAPEPLDMEKYIYVCDDGHAKPEGPRKKAIVEEFRMLGMFLESTMFVLYLQLIGACPVDRILYSLYLKK